MHVYLLYMLWIIILSVFMLLLYLTPTQLPHIGRTCDKVGELLVKDEHTSENIKI